MQAAKYRRRNSRKPAVLLYCYLRNAIRFDGGDHRFEFRFRGWNTKAPRCATLGQLFRNQRFDTMRLTERAEDQAGSRKRKCARMPQRHAARKFTSPVNEPHNRWSVSSPYNHCSSLAGLFHYIL
jgi:hypothetical protein